MDVSRGQCALRTLAAYVLPTKSYSCASSTFGARIAPGVKPLSYRGVLERTGSERIETTIRKRHLGFAGALVRQGDSRLSKGVMFGRLAVQGPKRGGRPATSWVDCFQKTLEAFGAVPRKGKERKWVAFGVVVKD